MLKILFAIVDVVLFVLGAVIAGTGIWILSDERIGHYEIEKPFTPTDFIYKSSYIVVVFGFVLLILGCVGCCVLFLKSLALLCCFASIFMVPIILILVAVTLAWYASENTSVRMALAKEMFNAWNQHEVFRNIEINLKCCGVDGPNDYENRSSFPLSCMIKRNLTDLLIQNKYNYLALHRMTYQNLTMQKSVDFYTTGCYERFQEVMRKMTSAICGLSTTIAILLIIALVLALIIRNKAKGGLIIAI